MSLRQLCKDRGFTLTKLSEKTEISLDYLSKLNTGIKKNPSGVLAEKISLALGASIEEVLKSIRNS